MPPNVFRVAFRTLRRNRGFAVLNVVGLALGMACVVLIALYVQDERGFDRFHERADRVVRLDVDYVRDGEAEPSVTTPGVLAPAIQASMPDVEAVVRIAKVDRVLRAHGEAFQTEQLFLADPEVFDVFSFPLLAGDRATALAEPGRIVLTETQAAALFGGTPALGQTVEWDGQALSVTGVMADVPRQSHLQFDGLISLSTVEDPGWYYDDWFSTAFGTYALLRADVRPDDFAAKLPAFVDAEAGDAMREGGRGLVLHANPLPDLYLTAERGIGTFGSETTLGVLSLVALFVLVVAGVNFTNLATARSLDRAREVGVRKSLGAQRSGLAVQFLAEAVVLSLVATALAVALAWLALPAFRELSGKPLSLLDLGAGWFGVLALAGATGLLAGAYPALVLSGFQPAEVLKGRFSSGRQGRALRQGLVVAQFAISVALIAATVTVFSQLRYMQSQDLGMNLGGDATKLLTLPFVGDSTVVRELPQIRARALGVPGVVGATASLSAPTHGTYAGGGTVEAPDGPGDEFTATMLLADTSYVAVYGLDLVAGRSPDATAPDARREYVLSEAAVREAGYAAPEAVLGKSATFWGMEGEVVGVVGDVHTEGLQKAVEPLVLTASDGGDVLPPQMLTLRVRAADLPATLASVGSLWTDLAPSRPFVYSFLDEDFAAQYVAEQRFGRLFGVFAGLAIVIACLGLFGLAAHAAATRTKEIGVRKVLGATVAQVVVLLSRNVVGLVGAGVVLAAPLVVFGMSRWLDGFAYRVSVGWAPLVLAGGAVLAVALLTVGGQALRAATADPVRALRSE